MPLRNRVAPWGEILARPERGTMMGNRGGRLHDEARRLGRRRWASRQWICCELSFRGRTREVMGPGYTELFFLDEAVALAAGHRPCFECRRAEARAFAEAWARGLGLSAPPRAGEMDAALHARRLAPPQVVDAEPLPAGTVIRAEGRVLLLLDAEARPWDWSGHGPARPRPRGQVEALTPPETRAALAAGYRPRLHPSATVD